MARIEEAFCMRHHWAARDGDFRSRCPHCEAERELNRKAWEALTTEQKVEQLRRWTCGSNWPAIDV